MTDFILCPTCATQIPLTEAVAKLVESALQDRFGQGGVGDVYRGHLHGEESFRTRFAIKRLRDDTEQHAHYFLNETRLGATLVHQNPRRDSW